jgi:hypothetical protein
MQVADKIILSRHKVPTASLKKVVYNTPALTLFRLHIKTDYLQTNWNKPKTFYISNGLSVANVEVFNKKAQVSGSRFSFQIIRIKNSTTFYRCICDGTARRRYARRSNKNSFTTKTSLFV